MPMETANALPHTQDYIARLVRTTFMAPRACNVCIMPLLHHAQTMLCAREIAVCACVIGVCACVIGVCACVLVCVHATYSGYKT